MYPLICMIVLPFHCDKSSVLLFFGSEASSTSSVSVGLLLFFPIDGNTTGADDCSSPSAASPVSPLA